MKSFSEIFNAWLNYTGVRRAFVAEKSGLDRSSIDHHAAGRSEPNLSTIEKYARVFNVTVPEFLTGPPEDEPYQYSRPVSRAAG